MSAELLDTQNTFCVEKRLYLKEFLSICSDRRVIKFAEACLSGNQAGTKLILQKLHEKLLWKIALGYNFGALNLVSNAVSFVADI